MLQLSLNGNIIPVPADFSMDIVVNSPFARFDAIPFSFSVDVSIPINEYTASIFGHPERFTKYRAGNDQKLPGFEVRFDGIVYLGGTLKINGVQGNAYDCTVIDPVGVLSEAQQNKSILDIAKFSEEIDWVNSANYDPATSPYACFPVNNQNFFKDKGVVIHRKDIFSDPNDGGKEKKQEYDIELLKFLHQRTGGGQQNAKNEDGTIKTEASLIDASKLEQKENTYDTGIVNVVTPFFFLSWVIKECLKDDLFFQIENYLEQHDDLKKICFYNNYDLTTMALVVAAFLNFDFDVNDAVEFVPGSIFSIGNNVIKYNRTYPETFKPVNHLPKMTVGELLMSTQNEFNVMFDFLPNKKYRILSRDEILKSEAVDLDKFALGEWVPDDKKDTAIKFTREVEDADLIFSEKFTDLTDRRADMKPPVDTWEDLNDFMTSIIRNEKDIRFVKSGCVYAEYKWFTNEQINDQKSVTTYDRLGWQQISIGFQNGWYNFGKDDEEIKTKFGVVYGYNSILSVLQQGNMNTWKAKKQPFIPRLMFYKGNNTGGPETDTLSLEYEKEDIGLIPKLWKNTAKWLSSRLPVNRTFDFPANTLSYLIYNKCKKYRTKEGEFIIDEMRFTLYVDHISKTTIKGFKV
jgi:hypothetical protein